MTEFTVDGMSCGGCVASITRAIQALDAAAKVSADLPSKKVMIDSTIADDALRTAIENAGYDIIGK